MAGWENELQELRDFIDSRCEDEVVGGMEDCYDIEQVNLTIDIVGQGEVEINTVDITPAMTPFNGWYFSEVPIVLEAEEAYGVSFLYWQVVSGDVTIANVNDPLLPLTLTGDAHLVAHFGIPVPPEDVMFNVSPEGAGFVVLDGLTLQDNPSVETMNVGMHSLMADPNDWWAFSHWSWNGNTLGPHAEALNADYEVFEAGMVTAHFVEIPHTDLTVVVSPQQAGKVRVENMAMVDATWFTSFEPTGPVVFEAISEEEWQFSHWEVSYAEPQPTKRSNPMTLALEDVPVEVVIAHFEPVQFNLFIPNAFTPDNDGLNDGFLPLGSGYVAESYSFMVFNRWGNLVFKSDNPDEAWIGQDNQRQGTHYVPAGVYSYRVEAQGFHDLSPTVRLGSVTVIR